MDRTNINTDYVFGVNTSKMPQIKGIVIHNTAGGNSAEAHTKRVYNQNWNEREAGFTHYWVDNNGVYQTYDDEYVAWHTGSGEGNYYYIGIEIVDGYDPETQQYTMSNEDFMNAENKAFELAVFLAKEYNLGSNCIKLHSEFINTACPGYSQKIHNNNAKGYFNEQVNARLNGVTPPPTPTPTPPKPQPQPENWTNQNGECKVLVDTLNIRKSPSLNGEVVAAYSLNDTFKYDRYVDADGIRWVSYVGASSGERRYVARKKLDNTFKYCEAY
jgi:N-acetylmuramoyl-L-alanine amidase CwlA